MNIRKLIINCLSLCAACAAAAGREWRVQALDPRHVVLQCDPYEFEQAAFSLPESAMGLTGWKFDRAFSEAGQVAMSSREEFERLLRGGQFAADGIPFLTNAFWKTPISQARFPDPSGKMKNCKGARILYHVFGILQKPMEPGREISFSIPGSQESVRFTYDPEAPSPLFKVNQVGYDILAAKRYAYLGGWLGPLGPWPAPGDKGFELVDAATGKVALTGEMAQNNEEQYLEILNPATTPYVGEETLEMDISAAPAGRYYLRVAGVGRSEEFEIGRNGTAASFAAHMKGLFHQRCGCDKPASLTRWPDGPCHVMVFRGVNPPEQEDYAKRFTDLSGAPVKTSHFAVNSAMIPTYKEELALPGGWHDAADYDRRPQHMSIVGDFAAIYMLRPENFTDSQLAVPERGNGIPDILDEAVWGMMHMLAGQQKDGGVGTWIETTSHPGPGDPMPSHDRMRYALSRATKASSMQYAAYAALLSRALGKAGGAALPLSGRFRESAESAWRYAVTAKPAKGAQMSAKNGKRIERLFFDESEDPPPPELVAKAAVNLYALTGEASYLDALKGLAKTLEPRIHSCGWAMSPLILAEVAFTEAPGEDFAGLAAFVRKFWTRDADLWLRRMTRGYLYRYPWYEAWEKHVGTMPWGNCHPHRHALAFVAAHAFTGDAKYLDAAYLANDYHNGCNPNGMTWTAGLGRVYPVSYLSLVSLADDVGEYVSGISPYRNTYGLPVAAKDLVWGGDAKEAGKWPILRRWANIESLTVAASEYTVSETIGPAAAVTGYLMGPGMKPENDMREPAADIRDLPGYWALP